MTKDELQELEHLESIDTCTQEQYERKHLLQNKLSSRISYLKSAIASEMTWQGTGHMRHEALGKMREELKTLEEVSDE